MQNSQEIHNVIEAEDIKIKFDGQTHQIEANTLINSLLHFTTVVQEINKDLKTNKNVEIKINALPEGSFLVHFTLEATSVLQEAIDMFAGHKATALASLITITGGVYTIAKFLKGKKPQSIETKGDNTTIINGDGDSLVIGNLSINIYNNNSKIQEAIAQEFAALDNDANVEGFQLFDQRDSVVVQIARDEFSAISGNEGYIETKDSNVIIKNAMLNIVRLSFDKNQKWEFYYEGNKISAKISEDNDFLNRIDKGEQFAKGDSLNVELEIRQEFDETVNTFINKSYKINKIIRHIPRPKQSRLFGG